MEIIVIVQVCIGSSCHLKGAHDIVDLMRNAIINNKLEDEVTLTGSFCIGSCNRIGVTVQVDDKIITGVTKDGFSEFFNENILMKLDSERGM